MRGREAGMKLRLLYTDSVPQSCPTVYETDHGTFVVQGDKLTDPEARSGLANMLPGEDAVEVPRATLLGATRTAHGMSRMAAPDSGEFDRLSRPSSTPRSGSRPWTAMPCRSRRTRCGAS
jgi:hypothetical protein